MASTAEEADLVHGRRFRLYRITPAIAANPTATPPVVAVPEGRVFICIATTMSLQRTAEFDDATAPKCSVPDAVADRKSTLKSRGWNLNFSGKTDDARLKTVEDDYESDGKPAEYVVATITDATIGTGTEHRGKAFIENITREKSDNGFVTFSAQLRGDGKLVRSAGTGV